jgi:hypothetical protein
VIINGKKFWTVNEMADELQEKPNTIKQRLFQAGKTPVCKDALYDEDALETIRNIQMGRPKKPASEAPNEPRKT